MIFIGILELPAWVWSVEKPCGSSFVFSRIPQGFCLGFLIVHLRLHLIWILPCVKNIGDINDWFDNQIYQLVKGLN